MTREEAVNRLSDIRADYSCFDDDERPKYHALSMAIEALQEEKKQVTGKLKSAETSTNVDGYRVEARSIRKLESSDTCGAKMGGDEE